MKIVDRKTFLAMPAGMLFAKCDPWVFDHLSIKGDTIHDSEGKSIDFFYTEISADAIRAKDSGEWADLLDESLETSKELPVDFHIVGRDGCFEENGLFAVLSVEDVGKLIGRLQNLLLPQGESI